MSDLIAQTIGIAAFALIVISVQSNNRKTILATIAAGQILFALHFYLLSAWIAVAMNAIGALRSFVFSRKSESKWAENSLWPYAFSGLFWLVLPITWQGYASLLPPIAMTMATIALWSDKTKDMRALLLASRPLWFAYAFIVGSYGGMLTDAFLFMSILVGMLRFDYQKSIKLFNRIRA